MIILNSRRSWFGILIRSIWGLFAALVILAAVALGLARLLLPIAGDYREDIERWASRSFGQPVKIAELGAAWRGFEPRLKLRDVQLLDEDGRQVLVRFDTAYIGIDIVNSFRFGEVRPGTVTVVGVGLALLRDGAGMISVRGFGSADLDSEARRRQGQAIENWLLRQKHLAIEASRIEWLDSERPGRRWHFDDVDLRLRNAGGRHRLDGSATLPAELGRRISFGADLAGNFLRSDNWRGRLYVQGSAVQLPAWLDDRALFGLRTADGTTDFRLWSEWRNGRPFRVSGDISAYFLEFAPAPVTTEAATTADRQPEPAAASQTAIDAVSARFSWQRHDAGWALGVERFLMKRGDEIWAPSPITMASVADDAGRVFQADLGFARLGDVAAVLLTSSALGNETREMLAQLQPEGTVHNLRVHYQTTADRSPGFWIAADFDEVTTAPWRGIPGVSGLGGSLRTSDTSGSMEFTVHEASVDFAELFRAPLPVASATGRVQWRRTDKAWTVQTGTLAVRNEDIQIQGTARLTIPDDDTSPSLNLLVNFENGNGANTARYLPVAIMPASGAEWLDRAIVNGRVTFGGALFRGRLADFPFDDGSGRFEVRFNVRDGILEYARDWPRLEEIETEVAFEGRSLKVTASGGKSFASAIEQAQVTIADLKAPDREVIVTGRAAGPTADALRYLRESPLRVRFGDYLGDARAAGRGTLDLDLRLPLGKAGPRIDGKLTFEENSLHIAGDSVDITEISGVLGFSEDGLSARDIRARLLGLPATVAAATDTSGPAPVTRFTAHGNATMEQFAGLVDLPMVFGRVTGNTDWRAELEIAPREITLHVDSPLRGTAIDLPEPLGKDAATARDLRVVLGLPLKEQPIRVYYGKQFNAVHARHTTAGGEKVDRIALHFGPGRAVVPEASGIHVTGALERFSLPEWRDVIDSGAARPATGPGISRIDLTVKQAEIFQRRFDDVELSATRESLAWAASVKSRQLTGDIRYPHDLSLPLVLDLDYLQLEKFAAEAGAKPLDPRDMPVLRVRSKRFIYGTADWGSLDMATSRRPDGLHLDHLNLASPTARVAARGDWVVVKGRHFSSIGVTMDAGDLGQVLKNLEYAGGIQGGNGRVELNAMWEGPLTAYALEKFDGVLNLDIENGRILEIEPGAGRLFGLLSVQALPRRLSLDFSDLFAKGYGFDKLNGRFSIDNGNAYTDDFYLDGPAARIEVKGKVGLIGRDYDQLVTVVPHITSSLPMAGVIAGGPTLGAAILLAEKLLKPGIDEIVAIQYSVKGDWASPVIERLPRQSRTESRGR